MPCHCIPLPKVPSAPADAAVRLEEEARTNGVGAAGDQSGPALEAGKGVLLNGQGVKLGAQAVGLLLPLSTVSNSAAK